MRLKTIGLLGILGLPFVATAQSSTTLDLRDYAVALIRFDPETFERTDMAIRRFVDGGIDTPAIFPSYKDFALIPGDFDGDGDDDLIVRSFSEGHFVYIEMQDGVPVSRQVLTYLPATNADPIDFDGDGKDDLLLSTFDEDAQLWRYAIWLMDGPNRKDSRGLGLFPGSFRPADFDGDSKGDLLYIGDDGHVMGWRMDGLTRIERRVFTYLPGNWAYPVDFDGDGRDDLLFFDPDNDRYQAIYLDGLDRVRAVSFGVHAPTAYVASGDFDGDGDADLLLRDLDDRWIVLLIEDGRVVQSGSPGSYEWFGDHFIMDWDQDGKDDVVFFSSDEQIVKAWLMDGAGLKESVRLSWFPPNAFNFSLLKR